MSPAVHELRRPPSRKAWAEVGRAAAAAVLAGVALAYFVVLAVRPESVDGDRLNYAVGALASAVGLAVIVWKTLPLRHKLVVTTPVRLDADGATVMQGCGRRHANSPSAGHEDPWPLTLPWTRITAVTLTRLDADAVSEFAGEQYEKPMVALRFVVADDDDIASPPEWNAHVVGRAAYWGVTPRQARAIVYGTEELLGAQLDEVVGWVREHRPDVRVVEGTSLPWASPWKRPGRAERRIAVWAAPNDAARRVLELARADGAETVALVGNEAHRSWAEPVADEVRMFDLRSATSVTVRSAVSGCTHLVIDTRAGEDQRTDIGWAVRTASTGAVAGIRRSVLLADPSARSTDASQEQKDHAAALRREKRITVLLAGPGEAGDAGVAADVREVAPETPITAGDIATVAFRAITDDDLLGVVRYVGPPEPATETGTDTAAASEDAP